jgi:drug/metabolite transporter (DMT)-like permease
MFKLNINDITPKRSLALFFLALTAVLWSLGGLLIKLVNWNPIAIAGARSLIAALLILFFIKKPDFKFNFLKFATAFVYAATVITFVAATKLTTAANAIILQYTAPIYVAIFGAIFLKEKVRWYDVITIAVVFGGMILFFIDKLSSGGMLGNLIAISSGVFFAFVALLLRLQKDDSPLDRIFWGNIMTAVIGLPFMFQSVPDAKSVIGIGLLGIFQLGFSYVLFSVAIKNVSALEAVLIPVIEPILNPIWVALVVHEVPGVYSLIGGSIVLIIITLRCIYTYFLSKKRETALKKQEFAGLS